jgi:uncharacterized YccA/Bax inhibitor family protein
MANTLVKPNPVLEHGLGNADVRRAAAGTTETMSINGTVHATAVFLFVLCATAAVGWRIESTAVMVGSMFIALAIGLYTNFKPMQAQYTGLLYAAFEGIFVGGISRVFEDSYPGIVFQAAGLTIAILAGLLALYRSGKIKVTENFKLGVSAAVLGVFLFYMANLVVGLFGIELPLINSSSGFGIAFSVFVVALASATLVIDFDFIEKGAEQGLPRQMNWFAAFGLMVSLVWLYLEILRLLAKLRER